MKCAFIRFSGENMRNPEAKPRGIILLKKEIAAFRGLAFLTAMVILVLISLMWFVQGLEVEQAREICALEGDLYI